MKIFEGQEKHIISLLGLMVPVMWFARQAGSLEGNWQGVSTRAWFWIAVVIPIFHQFGTMLLWRLELYENALTAQFGDRAFLVFQYFFFPGLIARPISVLALAFADRQSAPIDLSVLNGIAFFMIPILVYLFYSIVRYFGMRRAAGADHFLDEYRSKPLVTDGIYRFIPNAMYVVGFFIVWIPALLLASRAALVIAAFQHLFIWAHYFFTEKPDMREIYGID